MSNSDLDLLNPLFALVTAFILGGGISKGLECLPMWYDWHPAPNVKMFVVFVLTSLIGGAVVWLQQFLLPTYWVQIPDSLKILILSIAAFAVGQWAHRNDQRAAVKQQCGEGCQCHG